MCFQCVDLLRNMQLFRNRNKRGQIPDTSLSCPANSDSAPQQTGSISANSSVMTSSERGQIPDTSLSCPAISGSASQQTGSISADPSVIILSERSQCPHSPMCPANSGSAAQQTGSISANPSVMVSSERSQNNDVFSSWSSYLGIMSSLQTPTSMNANASVIASSERSQSPDVPLSWPASSDSSSQQTRSKSANLRQNVTCTSSDLVNELNPKELTASHVKLSDMQVQKRTKKQSSGKFTRLEYSLASENVSDVETEQDITELAISSDGMY
jgi:hypothetical protein